ncbi:3-deoxy-manno-octulosonate cytidylyltransferase [Nitrospiraceae bacterium AH_259_D15_M11_P09]|nr:3-deoxy-manno-octulosonate cytidylyltransferase [Nitrospiraceae bacterium AH_259_D15_M11_P09]
MGRIVAIIPARMASTRFPGKPLVPILGLPMIEHVRRRVALSPSISEVMVATCDQEITDVVAASGGKVVLTADTHDRCTDRVAEAARPTEASIIINVQGDEPCVLPGMLEVLVKPLLDDPTMVCTNLVARITSDEEFVNTNVVKVVVNLKGDALYFTREPIPSRQKVTTVDYARYRQLGIVAFKADFLQTFTQLRPTPLEKAEFVDMLRAVEHGYQVRVVETGGHMVGVDVPEDIKRVENILASDPLVEEYTKW